MNRVPAALALLVLTSGCATIQHTAAPAAPLRPGPGDWRTAAAQPMSRVHAPPLVDQTCRQVLRTTVGGQRLRLRLSNAGVGTPLVLRQVTVGLRTAGAAVAAGSLRSVTVSGAGTVTVPADGQVTTDPVALEVRAGADVTVSLAVQGATPVAEHLLAAATGYCSASRTGDLTRATAGTAFRPAGRSGLVVDALEVEPAAGAPTGVLAVGDSLTDAPLSPDRYERWSDRLAARLGPRVAVANAAIGGNRVQLAGGYGPTLLTRFARDVTSRPGIGTVVLLAGTNDVAAGLPAAVLTSRLAQLCDQAHAAGLRVVLLTLPPAHRRPARLEPVRAAVDRWIRTASAADAVVDADAVLRDPAQPTHLLPRYDRGDGLHLSPAGHRALGDAVAEQLGH